MSYHLGKGVEVQLVIAFLSLSVQNGINRNTLSVHAVFHLVRTRARDIVYADALLFSSQNNYLECGLDIC